MKRTIIVVCFCLLFKVGTSQVDSLAKSEGSSFVLGFTYSPSVSYRVYHGQAFFAYLGGPDIDIPKFGYSAGFFFSKNSYQRRLGLGIGLCYSNKGFQQPRVKSRYNYYMDPDTYYQDSYSYHFVDLQILMRCRINKSDRLRLLFFIGPTINWYFGFTHSQDVYYSDLSLNYSGSVTKFFPRGENRLLFGGIIGLSFETTLKNNLSLRLSPFYNQLLISPYVTPSTIYLNSAGLEAGVGIRF